MVALPYGSLAGAQIGTCTHLHHLTNDRSDACLRRKRLQMPQSVDMLQLSSHAALSGAWPRLTALSSILQACILIGTIVLSLSKLHRLSRALASQPP